MIALGLAVPLWAFEAPTAETSVETPSSVAPGEAAPSAALVESGGVSPVSVETPSSAKAAPNEVASADVSVQPSTEGRASAANIVFLQALGSGLFYSLNYERYIDAWRIGFRVGGSFFSLPVSKYGASENLVVLTFPVTASYYVGARSHKLQLGLGMTFLYTHASTDTEGIRFENERTGLGAAATAVVGYRYIPSDGGFSFGAAFTPLLRTTKFLPWGGIDVGYAF